MSILKIIRCTIIISLLMVIPVQAQETPLASDPCAGLVAPRLTVNQPARVAINDGIGVVVRDQPSTEQSQVIATLPEGSLILPLEGVICQDGFVWWRVMLPDGTAGYLVEGGQVAQGYTVEPGESGGHLYRFDSQQPEQLNHFFIDVSGNSQLRGSQTPGTTATTLGDLWQSFELEAARQVFADRQNTCPEQLPEALAGVTDLAGMPLPAPRRALFPMIDSARVLIISDYLIDIPGCDGVSEQYGTTLVSLWRGAEVAVVFPFSQHAEPPDSRYCQPPTVAHPDYQTHIDAVVWSPDGIHAALIVRYLGDGAAFPCAFYHVFVIDTRDLTLHYIGEGQRVGWRSDGYRLYLIREERTDPNVAGLERMISSLPDGQDAVTVELPPGKIWLPDLAGVRLPWTASNRALICNDPFCDTVMVFVMRDWHLSMVLPVPAEARPGIGLRSVDFIAGDTALLWLNQDGALFRQQIADGNLRPITTDALIREIIPIADGIGVILITVAGDYLYYDVLADRIHQITSI